MLVLPSLILPSSLWSQVEPGSADLLRVKQEEALRDLRKLEESMDRLARLLESKEPDNAARLSEAFFFARERTVREKMQRILEHVQKAQFDRVAELQREVEKDLAEMLALLLEKDIDPRELLQAMRRLRGILKDLDEVVAEETAEKLDSDAATRAEAGSKELEKELAALEDLIRREKEIEAGARTAKDGDDGAAELKELAPQQGEVRKATGEMLARDRARAERAREAAIARSRSPGPEAEAMPPDGVPPDAAPPDEGPRISPEGAVGEPAPGEAPKEGSPEGTEAKPSPAEGSPSEGSPSEASPSEGSPSEGSPSEASPSEPAPGEGAPRPPPEASPRPEVEPGSVLDQSALERAGEAMDQAREALEQGERELARKKASEARAALEEALDRGESRRTEMREARDFAGMKDAQEGTREKTEEIAERLKKRVPLVASPDGGVPGRAEAAQAGESMGQASQKLGRGRSADASKDQEQALEDLGQSRQKVEETLETLAKAFRDRLLAYLRERFQHMLDEQRSISRETRSLDLKLRALELASASTSAKDEEKERAIEVKDRQQAQRLANRESRLTAVTQDIADLLTEDGTTLVFPELVAELEADVVNAATQLERLETGTVTQRLHSEIETTLEEILKALEEVAKKPPPPNPNQGRQSRNGNAPLLPKSSELKMVRSLQKRVNDRTVALDLAPGEGSPAGDSTTAGEPSDADSPDRAEQIAEVARKQKQVEDLLRRIARSIGER